MLLVIACEESLSINLFWEGVVANNGSGIAKCISQLKGIICQQLYTLSQMKAQTRLSHKNTPECSHSSTKGQTYVLQLSQAQVNSLRALLPQGYSFALVETKRKMKERSKRKGHAGSQVEVVTPPELKGKPKQVKRLSTANSIDPPSTNEYPEPFHLEPVPPIPISQTENHKRLFQVFIDNGKQCLGGYPDLIALFLHDLHLISDHYNQHSYPSFDSFKKTVEIVVSKIKQKAGNKQLGNKIQDDICEELQLLRPLYQKEVKSEEKSASTSENSRSGEGQGGMDKNNKKEVIQAKKMNKNCKSKAQQTKVDKIDPKKPTPPLKMFEPPKTSSKELQVSVEQANRISKLFKRLLRADQSELLKKFRQTHRCTLIQKMTQKQASWFMAEVQKAFKRSGQVLPKWDSDEEQPESSFEVGSDD